MHWRGSWRMLNWNWRRARRKSEYWDPSSWRGKRPDLLFEESFNSLFWFSRVCFQTSLSTWSLWHALFSLLSRHFSYYKILGIPKDASSAEIKKAFRSQSLIHHPDKGGDEEKFKLVNEAFGILSDDDKRRRFDAGQDDLESDSPFGGGMGGGEEGEFWGEGWWKLRCRKVGEESNQDGWENLEPLIVAFTDPLFLPVLISLLLSLLHLIYSLSQSTLQIYLEQVEEASLVSGAWVEVRSEVREVSFVHTFYSDILLSVFKKTSRAKA